MSLRSRGLLLPRPLQRRPRPLPRPLPRPRRLRASCFPKRPRWSSRSTRSSAPRSARPARLFRSGW
ncbi:MAG: hypothetical protein C0486_06775 [Erythrobacter sp.]|nr:hypothetical protein [Erythrobacter sp.]MBA4081528.1 hypothetical protein [Erythrobacter sp.]